MLLTHFYFYSCRLNPQIDLTTGRLRCHAGIGNKKATNLHMNHTFWYTSLSSLLDYNV